MFLRLRQDLEDSNFSDACLENVQVVNEGLTVLLDEPSKFYRIYGTTDYLCFLVSPLNCSCSDHLVGDCANRRNPFILSIRLEKECQS